VEKAAPHKIKSIYYPLLAITIISLISTIVLMAIGRGSQTGIPVVLMLSSMAIYSRGTKILRGSAFTFWVFAFLASALYFPEIWTFWFGFNTKKLVRPLIQIIMFGMGTKLSVSDFVHEIKKPKGLLIGTFLVFAIMPVAGLIIAKSFGFEPEVAAGVILIGSCPGGVASNVMAFLANGNVALSVSITTFATLISPVLTPLLMNMFAGKLIEIPFYGMMISIMKMIILPLVAGLIVNRLLRGRKKWLDRLLPLLSMTAILLVACSYRCCYYPQFYWIYTWLLVQ